MKDQPKTASGLRLEWKRSLAEIDRQAWDALAVPLESPALEWEWLHWLEASGSVRPQTGWVPLHLTVWSGPVLVAAAPLYVKGHSEGEFVWDYGWAEAAQAMGIRYYPKLVGVSPATPVPGYRFLIAPGEDEERLTGLMLEEIDRLCRSNKLSGASFLYADPAWQARLEALGFQAWRHQSFAWQNQDFGSFGDYLAGFDKNQRRNVRRERQAVAEAGVSVQAFTGEAISRSLLERMVGFYESTNDQFGPWAARYLTPEFFPGLYEGYRHRLLLMAAFREGEPEPLGMSFLLLKGERMYGRYWGCREHIDSLHFEACYYAPIEWAIVHGVQLFDPGIGSPHKLRRGFRAVANHSLHRFYDSRLERLMARHIGEINRREQENIDAMNEAVPFAERWPGAKDFSGRTFPSPSESP
jgi:predicted N-acyltransferase